LRPFCVPTRRGLRHLCGSLSETTEFCPHSDQCWLLPIWRCGKRFAWREMPYADVTYARKMGQPAARPSCQRIGQARLSHAPFRVIPLNLLESPPCEVPRPVQSPSAPALAGRMHRFSVKSIMNTGQWR
jgi:hypothetical protein